MSSTLPAAREAATKGSRRKCLRAPLANLSFKTPVSRLQAGFKALPRSLATAAGETEMLSSARCRTRCFVNLSDEVVNTDFAEIRNRSLREALVKATAASLKSLKVF